MSSTTETTTFETSTPPTELVDLPALRPPKEMSGARKAAILCLSLGEEAASALFRHLDEDEVQILSRELALLPNVKSEVADEVLEEFHQLMLSRNYVTTGGVEFAKRLLLKGLGPKEAERMTNKMLHTLEAPANFEALQKIDPQQLAKLFQSEHPQTIAVVLAHLEPANASTILRQLPEAQHGDIILRLSNLQNVSQEVVKRIAQVLNQKLSSVKSVSRSAVGWHTLGYGRSGTGRTFRLRQCQSIWSAPFQFGYTRAHQHRGS